MKTKTFIIILLFTFSTVLLAENTNLNKKEIQWLSDHKTIRIAPDPSFPPIEYFDEQGNYVGISADYMKLIEEDLSIKFEVVHCKNWDEVLQKARDREVDLLPAAAQTPQRAKYMSFSSPHLIYPGVIITRNDYNKVSSLKQLSNKKVAVVSGYVWEDFFTLHLSEVEIYSVNSVLEGIRDVSTGKIDIMIGTLPVVLYYIEKEGIHNLQVAGETGYYTKLSIISRSDWPILNSIMEKSLQNIPSEQKNSIKDKWITLKKESIFESKEFWIIIILIFAISIIIIVSIYTWNKILKKQVNERTKELQKDIKIRKETEKSLKESELRYRTLFNSSKDAIMTLEPPTWNFTSGNPAICDIFGVKDESEFTSFEPGELSPEKQPDGRLSSKKAKEMIQIAMEKGYNFFEWTHKRINGEAFPATVLLARIKLKDKTFLQATVRDITERKEKEAEIKRSEKVQKILYNITDAVSATKDLDEFYEIIHKQLRAVVDTTNFYIALYDKETDTISLPYHVDKKDNFTSFPAGKTLTKYVIGTGKSLFADEKTIEKLNKTGKIETIGTSSKIWLGVP
ncbi:MAG: transporter substrate-binding domain-containing protein, partial [Candidatus Marinimicrobia bacterium]|nr:transporter substrate-binding domain-containing protein [Candidatus Neomarinimicrobiota bacterium]